FSSTAGAISTAPTFSSSTAGWYRPGRDGRKSGVPSVSLTHSYPRMRPWKQRSNRQVGGRCTGIPQPSSYREATASVSYATTGHSQNMDRNRKLLILVVAWVSAGLLSWFVYANAVAPKAEPQTAVVVAARDMPLGTKLQNGDLKLIRIPERAIPKGA